MSTGTTTTRTSTRSAASSLRGNPPRPPAGGRGGGGGDPDDSDPDDPPPPGGGGPPAPPAAIFALTPGRHVAGFIDYGTRQGQRLFETATAKLAIEFDCDSENLRAFVELADDRAHLSNWKMTTAMTVNGENYDLFDHYGLLTTDQIYQHVMTYIGQPTRDAQNACQMAECFKKSLTQSARTRVSTRKAEYTIGGLVDGLLYFKAIIKTATIDTRATTTTLRNKLSSLDTHMQEVESNVSTFIVDVKAWQQSLLARGETTSDLMVNIFTGLKACSDASFVSYIARKEDDYNEGQNISVDELLDLASNKYESLIERGIYCQPTEDQKKIVALTAKIEKLGKANKANNRTNGSGKGGKNGNTNPEKANKSGSKSDSNATGAKRQYETPEWKLKAPKSGESKTKKVKGRTYHWCKYHKMWCIHKESQCSKGKTGANDQSGGNNNTQDTSEQSGGNLQIDRNMQAVIEEDESSM